MIIQKMCHIRNSKTFEGKTNVLLYGDQTEGSSTEGSHLYLSDILSH